MTCEAIRDLLEAYALGALEVDEQQAVEEHLVGCPECSQLAAEYSDVVNRLPQALAAASPLTVPPDLKARVLQAVETPEPVTQRATPRPDTQRGIRRRWFNPSRLGSVAVLLLIVALVWIMRLSTALAQEQDLRARLVDETELIFEVVDSDRTTRYFLRPSPEYAEQAKPALPPYGKVFIRADLQHVVAMTGRMLPAPSGKVYNLWLFKDDTNTVLAGKVMIDSEGFGSLIYDAPQNGPVYESAQVILQDEGSSSPDGVTVLGWLADETA